MKNLTIAFLVGVIGILLMETPEEKQKDFNINCGCWMAFDSLQTYIDTAFSIQYELDKLKKPKKDIE